MSDRPVKAGDLEVSEVEDGYVVYQPARDRVHRLNHTAALVLDLCTGQNAEGEIAGAVQLAYDLPEPPAEEIRECIDRFRREGLVSGPLVDSPKPRR